MSLPAFHFRQRPFHFPSSSQDPHSFLQMISFPTCVLPMFIVWTMSFISVANAKCSQQPTMRYFSFYSTNLLKETPLPSPIQDSSSVHRYRVLTIKARFWGRKFSKLHNSNLTCNKPLISTDSHSMAAYIFLQWGLIGILHKSVIFVK